MERRYFLKNFCRYEFGVECPSCKSRQVQLIQYFEKPAEWKCRVCKCKFDWEPHE